MKWHNSRIPWQARKDRHRKNALRKAAYHADPEFWRNKMRKWREDNPGRAWFFAQEQKRGYWTNPWRKMVTAAKGRAKKKSLPFDLTFEWGKDRWTGFCELTGLPFASRREAPVGAFSPSIDRIDPALGYIQSNCRFVLHGINALKSDGTDEAMYFLAESLLLFRGSERTSGQPVAPKAGARLGGDDIVADNHDALLTDLAERHE